MVILGAPPTPFVGFGGVLLGGGLFERRLTAILCALYLFSLYILPFKNKKVK